MLAIFLAAVGAIVVGVVALRDDEPAYSGAGAANSGAGEDAEQPVVQPKSAAPRVEPDAGKTPATAGVASGTKPPSVFRPEKLPEPGSGHELALAIGWEEGDPRAEVASDWKRQMEAEVGELEQELENGGDPPSIWTRHNRLVERQRERLIAAVGEENLPAILRVVKLFKYGEQGEEIRIEE